MTQQTTPYDTALRISEEAGGPARCGNIEAQILQAMREGYLAAVAPHADLVAACEAALPAIAWGLCHQPGNMNQWRDVDEQLRAAIARHSPQAR